MRTQFLYKTGLTLLWAAAATLTAFGQAREIAPVLLVFIVGMLTLYLVGRWAARRLGGGITGDVYGALCELTELLCLLGLSGWHLWANG